MNLSKKYSVLGVMSGTSLDGIDFCWVEFEFNKVWSFTIKQAETIAYPFTWKKKLEKAHQMNKVNIHNLNKEYSLFLSQQIANFIKKSNATKLDFVSSHGHTILHQPQQGISLQIGNLTQVTRFILAPVVCNFRWQDVKLGGQGAPLVPIGDQLLFNDYKYCLNLGGFANVSFQDFGKRIAFDICPVNIVLNFFAEKLGFSYDNNGEIAKNNSPNEDLLKELNQLSFYQYKHPKSLGKEWVEYVFLPVIEKYNLPVEIVISTLTLHAAIQISKVLNQDASVLLTGGGVFNTYLISLIKNLSPANIIIPSEEIINFKEALIFAFLGVLRWRNEINVLASVTGALHNHSSGIIHFSRINT